MAAKKKRLYVSRGNIKKNKKRDVFHHLVKGFILTGLIFGLILSAVTLQMIFTGQAVVEDITTFSQYVNILADESITIPIVLDEAPEKFELKSFKISGEFSKGSIFSVYLDNGEKKLLVYDSGKKKFSLTGLIAGGNGKGNKGNSNGKGKGNSASDNSGGKISTNSPIKELVEEPIDNPIEGPADNTVINDRPQSQSASIPESAKSPYEFKEACSKTCNIRGESPSKRDYNLVIEVYGGSIEINKIVYSVTDLTTVQVAGIQLYSDIYDELALKGKVDVVIELDDSIVGINSGQNSVLSTLELASSRVEVSQFSNKEFKLKHKYSYVKALSGEINKKGLDKLLRNPKVKKVYIDKILTIDLTDTIPLISADEVWPILINGESITGTGEAVCVIDTGVDYTHPALSGRVSAQQCYCSVSGSACCPNSQQVDSNAMDDNGHGTHVAGIIASSDSTYKGVAPSANIVAVKTCNNAGYCSGSDIIASIEWCTSNAAADNISVISMSVGGTAYTGSCDAVSQSMADAINNAVNAGIMVVVSSGNNGYSDKLSWPSCITNAVSVGSVDKADVVASYSNRNSLLNYLAPGGSSSNSVVSTAIGTGFVGKYGTSMAAPHVSGTVLLLKQYFRLYNGYNPTVSEINGLLSKSADRIYDSGSSLTYDRINIKSAVDSVLKINSTANSVEKISDGKITFSTSTDLSSVSEAFTLGQNLISLESADWPQFNKAATLSLYNLGFEKTPVVLKNDILCTTCTVDSYVDGSFTFSVTGFTNYSAGTNSELTMWDESVSNKGWFEGNVVPNEDVSFFANYTARLTDNAITTGSCIINFEDSAQAMSYNSTKNVFEFSRSFVTIDKYSYDVNCSEADYENIVSASSLEVNKTVPNIEVKLNGVEGDISVLNNSQVEINVTLTNPSSESLSLYLEGVLIGSGSDILYSSNMVGLGNKIINVSYAGSSDYYALDKILVISVIEDTTSPVWLGTIDSQDEYGPIHNINLNWTDNVGVESVWIEHNFNGAFENNTMNVSGNEYSYNHAGDLVLGTYQLKVYANDTSGNVNSTGLLNYDVVQSGNSVSLIMNTLVNQDVVLNYQEINITATSSGGEVYLFKDGVAVANPAVSYVNVGNYVYFINASGNENYTSNTTGVSFNLTINKAESLVILKLNGNRDSITRASGNNVELIGELLTPATGTVKITAGGSDLIESDSPTGINTSFGSDINIVASYAGNTNYLPSSESHSVNVMSNDDPVDSPSESESAGTLVSGEISITSATSCTESWTCGDWSSCIDGVEERSCYDGNTCGTTFNNPEVSRPCGSGCAENWQCGEWSACTDNLKKRTCDDINQCGVSTKEEQAACEKGIFAAPAIKEKFSLIIQYAKENPRIVIISVLGVLALLGFLGYELVVVKKYGLEKLKNGLSNIKTNIIE